MCTVLYVIRSFLTTTYILKSYLVDCSRFLKVWDYMALQVI